MESLLAHDIAAENFIESPALEVAGRLFASDLTVSMDDLILNHDARSIGPYSLVQQNRRYQSTRNTFLRKINIINHAIGEGGMGEAWLAQQSIPFGDSSLSNL